jgi:hypothetical protein
MWSYWPAWPLSALWSEIVPFWSRRLVDLQVIYQHSIYCRMRWWLCMVTKKNCGKNSHCLEVICWHSPGKTKGKHEKPQSWYLVPLLRLEIQIRCVINWSNRLCPTKGIFHDDQMKWTYSLVWALNCGVNKHSRSVRFVPVKPFICIQKKIWLGIKPKTSRSQLLCLRCDFFLLF